MKKSQAILLKLANKFGHKYASAARDHIQQAVANAASWGQKTHGIMDFPNQLKRDQATLSITVSKNGNTVTVSEPIVNPPTVAGNYAGLPNQIKAYLEKYLDLFPKDEDNTNLVLEYTGVSPDGVAQR